MLTVREDEIERRSRAGGGRPVNAEVREALDYLETADPSQGDKNAVLIPLVTGTLTRKGVPLTPEGLRQRISSSIAHLKRSGRLRDLRLVVVLDNKNQVWIIRRGKQLTSPTAPVRFHPGSVKKAAPRTGDQGAATGAKPAAQTGC